MRFFLLLLVLVFSAAIRLRSLGLHSFELDEMATAAWALAKSFRDLTAQLWSPFEGNAFGYPAFIYLWGKLSVDPIWLRIPSVIAGALACAVFFLVESKRVALRPAVLGALLFSVSTAFLLHSQIARGYTIYVLFSYLTLLTYVALLKGPASRSCLALHAGFAAASLYVHHIAFFYLAVLWAHLLWRVYRRLSPARLLLAPLVAALLYAPHVLLLVHQLRHGPRWIPPVTADGLYEALKSLFWLHHGFAALFAATAFLTGVYAAGKKLRLELAWTLAPVALGALFSLFVRDIFSAHYFLPSTVGVFAFSIQGMGFWNRRGIAMRLTARVVSVIALVLALSRLDEFYEQPRGADFRGAAEFVVKHADECSRRVLTNPNLVLRWPIYLPSFELNSWPGEVPRAPYWILNAGYPLPARMQSVADGGSEPRWKGRDSLAVCVRE